VIHRVETWSTGSSLEPQDQRALPQSVQAKSLSLLGDQPILSASSTLSASSSHAGDHSGCNEFVSDPRLKGLGGLARKASPIWFSPFRLTPCGKKWKAFGAAYG
jgi:hypothetical protein